VRCASSTGHDYVLTQADVGHHITVLASMGDKDIEHLFDADRPIEQDLPIIQ